MSYEEIKKVMDRAYPEGSKLTSDRLRTKEPTITISKKNLVEYLIRTCPDRRCGGFGDGNSYCHSLMDKECRAMFVNPQECPWDCPHILTVSTRCTGEKCKKIKKLMKEIAT